MKDLQLLADKFSGARITLSLSPQQIHDLAKELNEQLLPTNIISGVNAKTNKDAIQLTIGNTEFIIEAQWKTANKKNISSKSTSQIPHLFTETKPASSP